MNKSTGILLGVLFVLSIIAGQVLSQGFLDFKPGQGGAAWIALGLGIAAAVVSYKKVFDQTLKYLFIVIALAPGAIALLTFWSK